MPNVPGVPARAIAHLGHRGGALGWFDAVCFIRATFDDIQETPCMEQLAFCEYFYCSLIRLFFEGVTVRK